jgi:hypothetical protein
MTPHDSEMARHEAAKKAARVAFDQLVEIKRIIGEYEDGELNVHKTLDAIMEAANGDARRVVRVGEQTTPEIQT